MAVVSSIDCSATTICRRPSPSCWHVGNGRGRYYLWRRKKRGRAIHSSLAFLSRLFSERKEKVFLFTDVPLLSKHLISFVTNVMGTWCRTLKRRRKVSQPANHLIWDTRFPSSCCYDSQYKLYDDLLAHSSAPLQCRSFCQKPMNDASTAGALIGCIGWKRIKAESNTTSEMDWKKNDGLHEFRNVPAAGRHWNDWQGRIDYPSEERGWLCPLVSILKWIEVKR